MVPIWDSRRVPVPSVRTIIATATAAAVAALIGGCGHTDISDYITARVTKMPNPSGFCIDQYYGPGANCFNARPDLLDGFDVGDCVTVRYMPVTADSMYAPDATDVKPATGC